jgi:hypothetical protein
VNRWPGQCVSPVAGSTGVAVYLLPAPKVAVQTGAPSWGRQGQPDHVGVTQFQQRSRQWHGHCHRAAARHERHHCLQQLQEPTWHVAPQGERRRPDWSLQHQLWQLRVQGLPGERCVAGPRCYELAMLCTAEWDTKGRGGGGRRRGRGLFNTLLILFTALMCGAISPVYPSISE